VKILLIDNGTIHLDELKKLLEKENLTTITKEGITEEIASGYELVILSGSSDISVATNPEAYAKEINLIKESSTPILGICMGFEVIAYTYGAKLKEMPYKEDGLVDIIVTKDNPIFGNKKRFLVSERHRWIVDKITEPLEELAISKDGVEAIKHKYKPIYGFQFHPEIHEDKNTGIEIFNNLLSLLKT